jgi:hypothetical protein
MSAGLSTGLTCEHRRTTVTVRPQVWVGIDVGIMREALERLDAEERNRVEQASVVLRKARAGASLPLEDITRRKEAP